MFCKKKEKQIPVTDAAPAVNEDDLYLQELAKKAQISGGVALTKENDWSPEVRNEIAVKVSSIGLPVEESTDVKAAAKKGPRNNTQERKTTVEEEIGLLRQELNEKEKQKRFKSS